ncbi:M23 family metallopeptidase [Agromyces mediolanus]|uniref:M23ase beta-sheet core domain-containing protein n=1 Tax=Agromyces mediolanus TaxID=41986 RepID=A0A918CDQ6_AGRME|nr:M23 family metallopeptidase [Agromyces mediolanus]GGR18154.1 hypothetical protein GCM10010196_09030 [Agromyces mediolanus]GLJ71483.1 hypothetical protein GCM10017583_07390 [Agromyces mediolanus]
MVRYQYPFPIEWYDASDPFGNTSPPWRSPENPHRGADFNGGASGTAGTPVPAIAGGVVVYSDWYDGLGNVVTIHHPDGAFSGYCHLTDRSVSVGQEIARGVIVGTVGGTRTATQHYAPHLHLTMGSDSAGTRGGAARFDPIPYIAARLDASEGGTAAPERYAVLSADGRLWVKEPNPYANWVIQASNVTSFSLSGHRIGVVSGGTAYVKEGDLYAGWVQVSGAGGIKDIVLDGLRIGILGSDGVLNVKEGNLSTAWVQQSGGVKKADLAGNRIGIIGTNAVVSVKEGDLSAAWVGQGVADDISLSGNRIGKIVGGVAMVKEGDLWAGWTTMTGGTGALAIRLDGIRVGVNTTGGLLVKEGGLSAGWTNQANGVEQFSLSGDKIGILKGGLSIVKKGTLFDGWINQMPNTTRIEVAN